MTDRLSSQPAERKQIRTGRHHGFKAEHIFFPPSHLAADICPLNRVRGRRELSGESLQPRTKIHTAVRGKLPGAGQRHGEVRRNAHLLTGTLQVVSRKHLNSFSYLYLQSKQWHNLGPKENPSPSNVIMTSINSETPTSTSHTKKIIPPQKDDVPNIWRLYPADRHSGHRGEMPHKWKKRLEKRQSWNSLGRHSGHVQGTTRRFVMGPLDPQQSCPHHGKGVTSTTTNTTNHHHNHHDLLFFSGQFKVSPSSTLKWWSFKLIFFCFRGHQRDKELK